MTFPSDATADALGRGVVATRNGVAIVGLREGEALSPAEAEALARALSDLAMFSRAFREVL